MVLMFYNHILRMAQFWDNLFLENIGILICESEDFDPELQEEFTYAQS